MTSDPFEFCIYVLNTSDLQYLHLYLILQIAPTLNIVFRNVSNMKQQNEAQSMALPPA